MADLDTRFELAAGTVMGRDHYHARQNRQDGWWVEARRPVHRPPILPSLGQGPPP